LTFPKFTSPKAAKQIVKPANHEQIIEEINFLKEGDYQLLQSKNYKVFLVTAEKIPNILHEIGRLREITFREVGEGTNEAIDLDKYDQYYHHMFLWDDDAQMIAGAYRMGFGSKIFPKPMPLFLLWKGIVHTTLHYPEHKFLIGGVSISNQFSEFSKSLMIEFMKSNYYDPYVAQYIKPKKEFKVKLKDADKDFVFNETEADLNKFDKIIDEIEPGSLRLPVLIKKYIKQNAKVVAFNVDPMFNNAIDGLMYIKISDIPESTVKPVMEEFQAELERKHKG
jgi:hypothetical protein